MYIIIKRDVQYDFLEMTENVWYVLVYNLLLSIVRLHVSATIIITMQKLKREIMIELEERQMSVAIKTTKDGREAINVLSCLF